jgi:hypothetical protein
MRYLAFLPYYSSQFKKIVVDVYIDQQDTRLLQVPILARILA